MKNAASMPAYPIEPEGDACENQLLGAGSGDRARDRRIVERVDRGAINDRNARQRLREFREGRSPRHLPVSWLEHLRQRQVRETVFDAELQHRVRGLVRPGTEPVAQHLLHERSATRP
jgi:hypothetical protein